VNGISIPADDIHVIKVDIDGKYIIFVKVPESTTNAETKLMYKQLGDIGESLETWLRSDSRAFYIWLNRGAEVRLEKVEKT
jgi:hypothetical protein